MRRFTGYLLLIVVAVLSWLLDNPITSAGLPAIGRLVDPVNGFWTSAEPFGKDSNKEILLPGLQSKSAVWFDKRMVPHIHAENDHDLYFLQGYVHAYFRLWQMDMQTRAAAGRISEIVGKKALSYDRLQRRKGMIYAAERSLTAMEANPKTKVMLDAYTEGINAFSSALKYKTYPLEYKLMGFKPEPWTNQKSALLLKYMADELTGSPNDIALTYLRSVLPADVLNRLYPENITGSATMFPKGTLYPAPSLSRPSIPNNTVFPAFTSKEFTETRKEGVGSNNWVLSGSRTKSGAAILCNDPHLGLHLPSLWYETQLNAPGINVYGVSLPGSPGIVIGFNDSVSWGLTNNYRDVKDYYLIKRDESDATKYHYDSTLLPFEKRIERIVILHENDFVDTVFYTKHGPLQYDERYPAPGGLKAPLAMQWMAHKATNELLSVYLLNRAKNYNEFVDAIVQFQCPAQSFIYADRSGNIALWGQGQFINKWKGQGTYIMDGSTKATEWGALIPPKENPHSYNPSQGYLFSANEGITDSTYPYWYNGDFREFRAWRIQQILDTLEKATIPNMFALQQDTYSILASKTLPIMLKHLPKPSRQIELNLLDSLKKWDYNLSARSISASIYQLWWFFLYNKTWSRFSNVPQMLYPTAEVTMQLLQEAETGKVSTVEFRELDTLMKITWKRTMDSIAKASVRGMEWYKVKNTTIAHLTNIPAFSYNNIKIGGWGNTVNAVKADHGPSWRMVVHMGKEIEAYGIYPGGQSGNPGSAHYADFINDWADGKYYPMRFFAADKQANNPAIVYRWQFNNK